DVDELTEGQRAGREPFAKRHAVDQLRGDEIDRARLPDLVHRDDVRMIERRRGAAFLLEAPAKALIRVEGGRQHLERDVATPQASRRNDSRAPASRSSAA